ncbi:MAG: EcoKI restriction-modification system protein HsdS [Syntrophus sp. PtaB.Bin075]|nr:MAG: EcoKI restriction-modification system protein HsdS [Syntrophus sp. PtaB.Bin075]
MKLAPYPEYKNAGVSWVGSIPAHWSEKRAKYYFKEIDERSQTGEEEMLSVSHITGVTPRSQKNVTMFKAESNVGQKSCQPGDLVINTMWAWMSALGVSNHAGIVSPAYGVYRSRSNQDYDYYYLDHLLRIEGYRSEYICRSTGIRSSRLRLYPDKFLSMPVVCPPQEEQQAIARFLKAQDRLFRKFVCNKRRLLELLKEQKQNIINQAVTRGLDPNVKFKSSGVEWIGDIPEHWEARRLKTISDVVLGKMLKTTPSKDDQLKPYLRSANIQWFEANISDVASMWFSQSEMEQYRISKNDILVSEGGEVGRACIWQDELEECYIQNSVHKVTAHAEILPIFLLYQFFAFSSKGAFKAVVNRVSIAHLTREKLVAVFFCKPPIEEQREILEHIQETLAEIDQAITRAQREIELMREYRTRLISDVVTGKVDVRGIEVPEVAEEELLILDEDTGESDDVIDDEGDIDESD